MANVFLLRLAIFQGINSFNVRGGFRFLFRRRGEDGEICPQQRRIKVDWKVRSEKNPGCLLVVHPRRLTWNLRIDPWKKSSSKPSFSGSMLIFGGVSGLPNLHDRKGEDVHHPNENRGVPHLTPIPLLGGSSVVSNGD